MLPTAPISSSALCRSCRYGKSVVATNLAVALARRLRDASSDRIDWIDPVDPVDGVGVVDPRGRKQGQ